MLYELACDDGNVINGDGCTANCTIEDSYVCMNASTTTPSICSYNGTIALGLDYAEKDPNSNSLTLTYKLEPTAPLHVLNNGSTDFTSLVSFPGK